VLHSGGSADPVEVVITGVGMFLTYVRWRHTHELKAVDAASLAPLPVQPPGTVADQADRDQVTASQARLNEFAAGLISAPGDRRLVTLTPSALREHNWRRHHRPDPRQRPPAPGPAARSLARRIRAALTDATARRISPGPA